MPKAIRRGQYIVVVDPLPRHERVRGAIGVVAEGSGVRGFDIIARLPILGVTRMEKSEVIVVPPPQRRSRSLGIKR